MTFTPSFTLSSTHFSRLSGGTLTRKISVLYPFSDNNLINLSCVSILTQLVYIKTRSLFLTFDSTMSSTAKSLSLKSSGVAVSFGTMIGSSSLLNGFIIGSLPYGWSGYIDAN